ncbi:hypothetical protein JCM11251_004228 [Rhodosporidiobolus azoricus]
MPPCAALMNSRTFLADMQSRLSSPFTLTAPYSPTIRKPSLTTDRRSSSRKTLTPPLPPPLLTALKVALVLLVFWFEVGVFHSSARGIFGFGGCKWDDSPSVKGRVWDGSAHSLGRSTSGGWVSDARWLDAKKAKKPQGTPFHVLVLADPQLLDMHSYPGRSWILRKLGVWITDLYARKSWRAVISGSRGTGGGGVDAVVWLGDLLDNTLEAVEPSEHASYIHRFHLLFPLPRASTSSFSTLSSSHSTSSSLFSAHPLTPPIPSIVLPGNHDLGLHLSSSSLAAYHRERFAEAFGPTWGEREWNGWRVVWVDAMALLEGEFWEGKGGQYSDMRRWLEEMGQGSSSTPTILLTHIPLFRPEGTSCGRTRESRNPLHQGAGKNYQNELGERETQWLVERVKPTAVYSGDDHDACVIHHPFKSPLDGVTPVVETTVKAFSMAMGVSHPGYHLLSLYAPLPSSDTSLSDDPEFEEPVSYTYTQTSCLLPSQLSIYLHVYLPLFGALVACFFLPKAAIAARSWLQRKRGKRRVNAALANGMPLNPVPPPGLGPASRRKSVEQEIADDEAEAAYPGLFGGVAHLDGSTTSPADLYHVSGAMGFENDGLSDEDGEILPTSNPSTAPGTPTRSAHGHVRRVSRVWLWEGGSRPTSPLPPTGSSSSPSQHTREASHPPTLLTSLFDLICARLASNTLLAPLFRTLLRPLFRLVRAVWRKTGLPVASAAGAVVGLGKRTVRKGGKAGQVVEETVREVSEVVGPAVGAWAGLALWYSL